MDWTAIGLRIRTQREFMHYTREQFAELLQVTPKFCADIELGTKGMSVSTLCRIAKILHLSTDHILFGSADAEDSLPIVQMLKHCSAAERDYAEEMLRLFLSAMEHREQDKTK